MNDKGENLQKEEAEFRRKLFQHLEKKEEGRDDYRLHLALTISLKNVTVDVEKLEVNSALFTRDSKNLLMSNR